MIPSSNRHDKSQNLALAVTTSAAILTLLPIAASQLGWTDRLLESPGRIFDSKKIIGSKLAHPLGIPDSLLGIVSYGVTLGLAYQARSHPTARRLLAGKLVADGAVAGFNVVRQVVSFRKICSWCMATAVCTVVMLMAGRKHLVEETSELVRESCLS